MNETITWNSEPVRFENIGFRAQNSNCLTMIVANKPIVTITREGKVILGEGVPVGAFAQKEPE